MSRITAVVLGVFGIALGILANGQNIAFLVALAFAVAAAANLPTILYSLYWQRFNTRGAVEHVRRPDLDHRAGSRWPTPASCRSPLAFILGIVGTLTSPERGDPELDAEMEVRSLTGIGAEKAVVAH